MSREMLTVNEIFHSIQGESSWAGLPCVFVRLTACDLRCSWCDTPYAFTKGRKRSLEDVAAEVESYECPLVEITGGEPLLQEDVYPLMQALLARGRTVLLETGGHIALERVPAGVVIVMDVKCPSSGESRRVEWRNLDRLGSRDEVKFVIQDRGDYVFARTVVSERGLVGRVGGILFSPVHGVLDPRELSAWILQDRLPVRLQLQVHKYIWGAATRGV
jgi:7-carboxy-7-deazaguanine synthase